MANRKSSTSLPSIVPEQDKMTQELQQQGSTLLAAAEMMEIVDALSLEAATNTLGVIADTKKRVEERRQFFVKPLNDHVKTINNWFKSILAPLEQADSILRQKILKYRQEEARKRKEEEERLRKLMEEQAKQNPEVPVPTTVIVPQLERTVQGAYGQVQAREVWMFKIVDESQIPREYLMPNEKAIRAAVKGGVRNIPGVLIYKEESLAVRSL